MAANSAVGSIAARLAASRAAGLKPAAPVEAPKLADKSPEKTLLKALDTAQLVEAATGIKNLGTQSKTTDVVISPRAREEVSIAKPKKPSANHVLFAIVNKRNLGSVTPSGKVLRFVNGYYMTDDKATIEFIRANAKAWSVVEE